MQQKNTIIFFLELRLETWAQLVGSGVCVESYNEGNSRKQLDSYIEELNPRQRGSKPDQYGIFALNTKRVTISIAWNKVPSQSYNRRRARSFRIEPQTKIYIHV